MARFNYSGVAITAGTGRLNSSLGGTVLLKNGVVRNYVTPVNPQTADQSEVRGAFSFLTSAWKGLTESQRQTWEEARLTDAWQKQDPFTGTSRPYSSGKSLFISSNLNCLIANNELDTPSIYNQTAPVPESLVNPGFTSIVADASAGTVVFTYPNVMSGDGAISVRFSPPVSAGNQRLTSVKSKLRTMASSNAASPLAYGTEYVAKFGAITAKEGMKIGYTISVIGATKGNTLFVASGFITIDA